MPPVQPAGVPGFFSEADVVLGVPPTTLTCDWPNIIQSEIINCLTQVSITPDKTDSTQLYRAILQIATNVATAVVGGIAGIGNAAVPLYGIILWYGSVVPDGWLLCDGTGGTPNLSDRFVVGIGEHYLLGWTGGFTQQETAMAAAGSLTGSTGAHTLTVDEIPPHHHGYHTGTGEQTLASGFPANAQNSGPFQNLQTDDTGLGAAHNHTMFISDHTHPMNPWDNRPPFFALAYIMRVV
jgi:microcystin-dependent protein